VNIVHFDTSRLTPLGWLLLVASWISLIGLFVLIPLDAPRFVIIICVGVFFLSLGITAILDYAGDAVHFPRAR
jgi:hypothetical protein